MLTIQACGFIAASSRSPTMCLVASVAGAAITKWSALPQISSIRSTGSVPSRPERVTAITSTSCGASMSISTRPIPPAPTIATVEPSSTRSGRGSHVFVRA